MAKVRFDPNEIGRAIKLSAQQAADAAGIIAKASIQGLLDQRSSLNKLPSPSPPGSPPAKQDGGLYGQVDYETRVEGNVVLTRVGTKGIKYAAIHEFGGTIPSRGKLLTVPLNLRAKKMRKHAPSLRTYKSMYYRHSPKGSRVGLLMDKATGVPMFSLKKSVKIPKRPYMRPGLKAVEQEIVDAYASAGLLAGIFPPTRAKIV